MDDALLVRGFERVGDLARDGQGVCGRSDGDRVSPRSAGPKVRLRDRMISEDLPSTSSMTSAVMSAVLSSP